MRQGFYKVVLHHIFLGITAMLMMKQTLVISTITEFNPAKYFIAFLSTIIVYQLAVSGLSFPFKSNPVLRNKVWIAIMAVLIVLLSILVFKALYLRESILLFCVFISCLGYFISIHSWKGLRANPVIKGVLLAMAWSMVTVVFPLINQWNWNHDFTLLTQRFLFMLAICIIYNLKDVDIDRRHNIVTIASLVGERNTKIISGIFLLLFVMSVMFTEMQIHFKTVMVLSAFVTLVIIIKSKINGAVYYYRYVVDGCMMLQSLLIICLI